jgi:3-hydroxyisobutyrate dehydrogenase-like beta-hydroxyacid dehydrogenase
VTADPASARETIGMVGLGAMGSAMAANLLRAGFAVVGHDPVPARLRQLADAGGTPVASNPEVADQADRVITSLPSVAAFERVTGDLAAAGRQGLIVVETSTLPLAVKEQARERLAEAGITLLDCPLSGTSAQARHKDVVVYASGDEAAVRACAATFAGFARSHHHLGPFGAGSKAKYIANLLVAIHNVAAAEALTLSRKAGLDPRQVLDVIADGAGTSRMFEVRGPKMVDGDFEPGIKVSVFAKDLAIITAFAAALDCPVPVFAAAAQVHAAAGGQGFDDLDTASVSLVLERLAGVARADGTAPDLQV